MFKMDNSLSITVITKLITPNAGNQAISTELIRLLVRKYPDACIYTYWQEHGLEQYSLARLQHAGPDPLRTLDSWAEDILKKYDSDSRVISEGTGHLLALPTYELSRSQDDLTTVVKLNPSIPPISLRLYNKGLRTLRQFFSRWGVYGRNYENWLNIFKHSDWVIYSPAGAVIDACADDRVRDLLGLRIAQKLGTRIAAVNQSIEVTNPLLLSLLGQLYSTFDDIIVRDPFSAEHLTEIQVPEERIRVAPDTAYLAQPTSMEKHKLDQIIENEEIKPGTVGIAVQPRKKGYDYSDWGEVIEMLRARGKQVIFISHEMSTDIPAGKELQKRYNVKTLSRQYNYDEYIHLLSQLELVISERYHTCVFSAIAGKPFIPINVWKQRKMHGIVWSLDYPIAPLDNSSTDWVYLVQNHIEYISKYYDRITASLHEAVPRLRKLAEENARCDSLSTVKAG